VFGSPTQAGAETIFGKPLIVSPLLAPGIGLVGAFAQGATIYDRHSPRIAWATAGRGDGDTDLFVTNLVRARAEERLGFVVNRPAAFCKVDFIP
jgi:HK97 family phage major capsid protein